MSGIKGNTNPREALRRARQEAKKPHVANTEASMDDGNSMSFGENVANTVSKTMTERIGSLMEQKFTELHSILDKLSSRVEEFEKRVKMLTDRAEDSENRSRRESIRIIGLKEGAEGNQAVRFFKSWLPDTLGLETKRGSIKIDREHRALGPPKKNYNQPVIINLHNFSDKQQILAAVREKGEVTYLGDKIYIHQDLSAQVREARRQFNGVCERLIRRGLRFQMRYPSSSCFTFNGEERSFKSPRETDNFLSKKG